MRMSWLWKIKLVVCWNELPEEMGYLNLTLRVALTVSSCCYTFEKSVRVHYLAGISPLLIASQVLKMIQPGRQNIFCSVGRPEKAFGPHLGVRLMYVGAFRGQVTEKGLISMADWNQHARHGLEYLFH